jgi:hypothetical protein
LILPRGLHKLLHAHHKPSHYPPRDLDDPAGPRLNNNAWSALHHTAPAAAADVSHTPGTAHTSPLPIHEAMTAADAPTPHTAAAPPAFPPWPAVLFDPAFKHKVRCLPVCRAHEQACVLALLHICVLGTCAGRTCE